MRTPRSAAYGTTTTDWTFGRPTGRALVVFPVAATVADRRAGHAMQLARLVLGAGFASRLMHRLRVELGLVYSVAVEVYCDEEDPDLTTFQLDTTCDAAEETVRLVAEEMVRLTATPPTAEERERLQALVTRDVAKRAYDASPAAALGGALNVHWTHAVHSHAQAAAECRALLRAGLAAEWSAIFAAPPAVFLGN